MCAATAVAVAGVAATAAGAYSSYSASKAQGAQAKDAAAALAKNQQKAYGSTPEEVKLPDYDPTAGAKDYKAALPDLIGIASSVNGASMKTRDKNSGGMFTKNLNTQGQVLGHWLKGEVAPDVVDETNRTVAERAGGGFSPDTGKFAGGNSTAVNEFARNIGLNSHNIQTQGMSMAPQWEQLVDSFTYKPQDAANMAMQFLSSRHEAVMEKYQADLNESKRESMPDPQFTGNFRDQQQLLALQNQADKNKMDATIGMFQAGAGAAGQLYNIYKSPSSTGAAVSGGTGGGGTGGGTQTWQQNAMGASLGTRPIPGGGGAY